MQRRTFVRSAVGAAFAVPLVGRDPLAEFYRVVRRNPGDVVAVRGDGTRVTIPGARVEALARDLRGGRLLLSNSEGYDTARLVLNPDVDRRPALIAQPAGTPEVQRAVAFAREFGLLTAVKCGGHSFSGQSTCDDGLMIDLVGVRGVEMDAARRRVRVAGGSLLGAVDAATRPHDLVTPLGTVSHTGVGGLTTGGGFGRVARRFGLALDNVTAMDVVTADGSLVRATATQNEDLFWGVRGAGGNFGIVTSFEFRLHPMPRRVLGGDIAFPLNRVTDVLRVYADYVAAAPDELYLDVFIIKPPGDAPGSCGFSVCWSGPPGGLEKALAPVRRLGTPADDGVKPIDYVDLQKSGDVADPRAMGNYVKSGFAASLPDDMIRAIAGGFEPHPGRVTIFFTQHSGGAINRVPVEATAFPHRRAAYNALVVVGWPHGSDRTPHVAYARRWWDAVEPFSHGWYTNEVADESTAQINANYGPNYPRLVRLKNRYDPTNLFRLNANVAPTV